jgi:hypothetical protein
MTVAVISLDTRAPRMGGANRTATAVVMVPAALRRTAPRPTTSRPVRVRAAADRALVASMPSVPVPRMTDAARVASAVATSPAGKVTAPTTAALAVSTAHRAGVAARVVRMLPVANSAVMARAARAAMPTVTTTAASRLP